MSNGAEHLRDAVIFSGPCPQCGKTVTWRHQPGEPFPLPTCPTCNTRANARR